MHMTSSSDPTSADNAYALDLSPEAILARAGRQHAMLDRMAVLGMRLVEEVVQRAVDAPHHPEVKHEPTRAFAQVTRAVRFTLALQTRIEARMIAIRNVKSTACTRRSKSRPLERRRFAAAGGVKPGQW
jgi:hypothetical protein